jgi:hypothetical protein
MALNAHDGGRCPPWSLDIFIDLVGNAHPTLSLMRKPWRNHPQARRVGTAHQLNRKFRICGCVCATIRGLVCMRVLMKAAEPLQAATDSC